jgi:hypothetical protein
VASSSLAARGIFASRSFRQYYSGQTLSLIGDGLRTLAVPLIVYRLTGSALSTGVSYVCEIVPFALFTLVGGIAGRSFGPHHHGPFRCAIAVCAQAA